MKILHFDTVNSTNTYALRHFGEVADNVLVSAGEQTAGRGRVGRRWLSPRGASLSVSFAMTRVENGFHAGVIAGPAVLDLVRETVPGADPYLKWPNDIYVGDAKLSGILCEGVLTRGRLAGVVAGIGVNVNLSSSDVAGIDQRATSLNILSGKNFSIDSLVERLAFFLERRYINYDYSREQALAGWRRENRLIGRTVTVVDPAGKSFEGRFSAIDDDGAMVLDTPDGRKVFRCGDVKITRGFDPNQ